MIDIRETLLSQYANSPCITSILKSVNEAIDPRQSSDEFYHLAINVLTAQGFGLDIWGRIVGINRGLTIPDPDADYFGFDGTEKYLPFNQEPFFGDFKNESSYLMTDPTFREVIIMKAYANIINATAPNINTFLKTSFTRGKAYFLITGHMKGRYVFEYRLSELEKNLIFNHSILPRPNGVEITIRELPYADYFGFFGSGFQTFNQAPFIK
ncbi:DUF2612 domain-containing protein [Providencia stuartii]|uniref:DUF2612 domain-containing protein n=1 Tax=Providencia TaxID=586 RepID=UPI0013A72628|nr:MULTISPECIES: DUF2612 domain-containing protein [Providencia]MBQ0456075.1 DUF2612 domain-containing protein [Providencia stuartii]MDN7223999.1 DUF2612 domain-containing protein [Providencia stuartii]QIB29884.1 DUF2612 domain-containing protein [Providencia stuartii]QPN42197.1 DUF2612 domain-containing protein [Providencia sp. 2.29]WAZ77092.1 DUF2612 domain-containing protein [Providencia stuartii]